ncbi:pre-rRNA processing protein Utp22 [Aspergillus sclerotialis]|uniref:U3 small nucleolar RNA-associated protein 22 n=1 Tax=Aspergillus sclerotialis TaxID=2070753 RepID=A0A3A3A4K7_9EURO|nr:pre-rRNA processing protein Utp22 [Aspergillus sclerotialis]
MSLHTSKRRKLSPSPEENVPQVPNANGSNEAAKLKSDTVKYRHSSMNGTMKGIKNDRSAEVAFASGLYKSSFFKLQLDELLGESRPNYNKQGSRLHGILHMLKDLIECIPDRPSKPVLEAEKDLRNESGISVPFPEPRPGKETKYPMSYAKPSNVNVVGSFALRTGIRMEQGYLVDLAVTMPSSLFQDKDFVNHRYFHKRAYYIACLAAGIKESKGLSLDLKFGLQDGDSLRPVIILEPTDSLRSELASTKSQIRIITAVDDKLFSITRTLPLKHNIRRASSGEEPGHEESMPFYNGSLRSESTVAPYHKYLHLATQKCDSFRDACVLGRIWLKQRGFGSAFQSGGFGGFEWSLLLALLFECGGPEGKPILSNMYSSYQLFKATMQFISRRDLTKPLLCFGSGGSDIQFPNGCPVIYDCIRGTNLLYKMTPWSYALFRHEADATLKMLNESRDDNFENVFIVKVSEPMMRFDRVLSLPSSGNNNVLRALHEQLAIYRVISRALGDRVKLISLSSQSGELWSVETKQPRGKANGEISVGLVLDADNSSRVVDHGPSAEQKEEAASFRDFWGGKAELRRFKDGSILESLVWSDHPSSASVVYQILTYILQRHFNTTQSNVKYIGDDYDEKLRNAGSGILSYSSQGFQLAANAFTSLERSLHSMDDIPLTVRHVAPAAPLLRYTALQVPNGADAASEPVDIVLQFESSARWPDDLAAIQMTKVAFLIKIGDALDSSGAALSCNVGLENESSKILNNAFLDIIHSSGVTFRLRIHHDREQTLLDRQLKEKDIGPQAREETAYALSAYRRIFIQVPRLTQAIRTLCTRYPLLSPTIRLVKHWFNSHLFAAHVNEELIELLATRTFTHPHPWEPPSSVMTGFLRTLHFLSRWDWHQEPLVVGLGGELDQTTIEEVRTRLSAWRSIDPAMNTVSLFAASDIDHDGTTWTKHEIPPKVVAGRMSTLAKASIKLLREKGCNLDIFELFHTSLAPYDFIVSLRPKALKDRLPLATRFKGLNDQSTRTRDLKSTAFQSFIRDLQACYSQSILLFHGGEHSDMVAGLWNPQTMKPKGWSLKTAYSVSPKPSGDSKERSEDVSINNTAILNEISRLGTGLIESIEVHKA